MFDVGLPSLIHAFVRCDLTCPLAGPPGGAGMNGWSWSCKMGGDTVYQNAQILIELGQAQHVDFNPAHRHRILPGSQRGIPDQLSILHLHQRLSVNMPGTTE